MLGHGLCMAHAGFYDHCPHGLLCEYKKGQGRPRYHPFYHVNVLVVFIHSKSPTYSYNPLRRLMFHARLLFDTRGSQV